MYTIHIEESNVHGWSNICETTNNSENSMLCLRLLHLFYFRSTVITAWMKYSWKGYHSESGNSRLLRKYPESFLESLRNLLNSSCIFKTFKGSRKWTRRRVRIVANVRYLVSDHGDRYLFTFWTCTFWVQIQFPFPFVTTKWTLNRRSLLQ
jgi:hypothetical protein